MTKDQELAQKQAQEHPPPFAGLFGDLDGDPPLFEGRDEGRPPPRSSSAHRHAQRRFKNDRQASQEQDQDVIARAAQEEADDIALAQATRLANAEKPVPPEIMAMAARAARARGTSMSSAEIMAMQVKRRG